MRRLAVLFFFAFMVVSAHAQSAPGTITAQGKVCIWVDSEGSGSAVEHQTGGSVSSITRKEVAAIRNLAVEALKINKSNNVVNPCPQTGENIEVDVVVGKFRSGYVASVSTVITGGRDGPLHVSSNVIAASTTRTLALDVAIAYESLKFRSRLTTKAK